MAITDTLNGKIKVDVLSWLNRSSGNWAGKDTLSHSKEVVLSDGTGSNQASGWFGSSFTCTTGGITVSLADSADPLGAAGDDVPSSDPEGLKLRAILIENQDDANFISVKKGTNGETSIFSGSTDSVQISAGGMFLWTSPAGINAMEDGTSDELLFTADTASCTVKLSYLYG